MTEEGARIMRAAAENSGRMSVLVPLCVAQFTATDGAMARFKASSVYSRENLVSDVVKNVESASNIPFECSSLVVRSRMALSN